MGWNPGKTSFKELVKLMVEHDIAKVASEGSAQKVRANLAEYLAEYVASLESATVNGLPVSIAKFAVSTFNKDNAEVYKDNTDFLILVLKNGSSYQVKLVDRLMKDKINHETDLDQVVTVLDNRDTEDQEVLKTLVGELDGIKDSETVNEETKAQVAALSTKLSVGIKKTGLLDKVLGKKS